MVPRLCFAISNLKDDLTANQPAQKASTPIRDFNYLINTVLMKKSNIYGQKRSSTLNQGKSLSRMKQGFPEKL